MKKILSIILIITTMFGFALVPSTVQAKTYKGFTYKVKNKKVEILSYNGKASTLKIPEYIKGYKVTSLSEFVNRYVKKVRLSRFISSINSESFKWATKLKTITVDKRNKKFTSKSGVLYNKKKTKLVDYPIARNKSKFSVPKSVKYIGSYAFSYNKYLKNVVTNKKLKIIGKQSFTSSKKLKKIVFSKSVVEIGKQAFANCKNLESINIPKNIKSIKRGAFVACKKLKKLTIAKNENLVLYDSVFANTGLIQVTFPKAKKYGSSMFKGCSSLEKIEIPSYVTETKAEDFMCCPKLKTVTIPKTVKKIGEYSFGYIGGYDENYPKLEGFTIKGYKGTAAEKYATDNGFKFVALG